MSANLTHFDAQGQAHMVDVGEKEATHRVARATGHIQVAQATLPYLDSEHNAKGDVLSVARIAAIMASKQTPALIPLCHPLMLNRIAVDFRIDAPTQCIHIDVIAQTHGVTGVEMEALTAVSVGLLTIYDMLKAVDKTMLIQGIGLVSKEGGKSGSFNHPELMASPK